MDSVGVWEWDGKNKKNCGEQMGQWFHKMFIIERIG